MAFFSGARISLNGEPFGALDAEVSVSVPDHGLEGIRAGIVCFEIVAPIDTRVGRIIALKSLQASLSAGRQMLRSAGVICRAYWLDDDLRWRVGRSGDVVAMLDDLSIPAVQ